MSKYSEAKKAYDKLVKLKRSGLSSGKDRSLARSEFRAAAFDLFPRAGSRAEAATIDLIEYYAKQFSRRKKSH